MPLVGGDCEATFKVLILGESGVGKTALLHSLVGKPFKQSSLSTVGVDFVRKIFEVDGALVQLTIWDTAGQEKFRSITRRQFRRVQGVVLVYDLTRRPTFDLVTYWLHTIQNDLRQPHSRYEPIPVVLCGNKADMADSRQVATFRAQELAKKELLFEFFETSARTGQNVYKVFQRLAYHVTDICHPKLMKSYHPYCIRGHEVDCFPSVQRPANVMEDHRKKTTIPTAKKEKNKRKKNKGKLMWCCACVREDR